MALNKELAVSHAVIIKTDIKRVWSVLTEPDLIKKYLYGTETITDWKVGNHIIFQGEYNGLTYKDKGRILEFLPHKKLVYSYWSSFSGNEDIPENYANITYIVESIHEDETKFTWTTQGFKDEETRNHEESKMTAFLNSIKEVAEEIS